MQSIPSEQHAALTLSTIIKSVMPNNPTCNRFGILTYVISVIALSCQSSDIYFLESVKSTSISVSNLRACQAKLDEAAIRFKSNRYDPVCNFRLIL